LQDVAEPAGEDPGGLLQPAEEVDRGLVGLALFVRHRFEAGLPQDFQ